MNQDYVKNIERYYEECERDYEIVWQLRDSMALHYGYWDEQTATHRQALWNMNYQLAKHAQIQPTDRVLDAGCGIGGTVFFLAQQIGCQAHGITISPTQVKRAQQIRQQLGLEHLTEIIHGDYTQTPFPDQYFDVVLGLESIVHAEQKADFLKEAYRILKPGGRLVMADYFIVRPPQNPTEEETLKKWGQSWSIRSFIDEKSFIEQAKNEGFATVFLKDLSTYAFPSIKLMHRSAYPGLVISRVSNFFGRRTHAQILNSKSGRYQYVLFRKGIWRYKYFLAIKPPVNQGITSFDDYVQKELIVHPFVDSTSFQERFPIVSKNGISFRNLTKRLMHFYLETGIRRNDRWF